MSADEIKKIVNERFPFINYPRAESACGAKMWNSAIKDMEKHLGGGDG